MSYVYKEFVIELDRLGNYFQDSLELNLLEYTIESGLVSNTKSIIKKLCGTFLAYILDVIEIAQIYREKKEIQRTLTRCKKAIKYTPNLAKKKILYRSYERLGDLSNIQSSSDMYKVSRNLGNKILIQNDKRLAEVLDSYHDYKASTDEFYEIRITDALVVMEKSIMTLDNVKNQFITSLTDFQEHAEKSEEAVDIVVSNTRWFLKNLQIQFQKVTMSVTFNLERLLYEIKKGTKEEVAATAEKYHKKLSDKDLMKKAILKGSYTWCTGETFNIYEIKEENMSCFNVRGKDIYVDSGLFKLPKAYINAVILHEIGHTVLGHFDSRNGIEDEVRQTKHIKKEMEKFDRIVSKSEFNDAKDLTNDSELVYILLELEADRYSSGFVGKKSIQHALTKRFDESLKKSGVSKEDMEYNQFRMRLRTSMI